MQMTLLLVTLGFIKLLLPHLEINYELSLKHNIYLCWSSLADIVLTWGMYDKNVWFEELVEIKLVYAYIYVYPLKHTKNVKIIYKYLSVNTN